VAQAKARILLVEDDSTIRAAVAGFLRAHGLEVDAATSCAAAEEAFRAHVPDAMLLDQVLPDGSGIDLLRRLKSVAPGLPVVMLTGHGSIELAVRAIKEGAEQFLTKPIDMPAVLVLIERMVLNERQRRHQLASRSRERDSIDPFLGRSRVMANLAEEARRIAAADSTVLLQGETGTGKGVLAKWIHEQGSRADEALVDLNCAGLSKDLLESELFGHEAGAFTGATRAKPGLIEGAHRGSLFLDEIGDMDPVVQPKVLKVLDERRFRRVGDVRDRQVDVRLIAATHRDLAVAVQDGAFRSDLFFRISTLTVVVPPLRDRVEDIPFVADHLVERIARDMGRHRAHLTPEAVVTLQEYAWPGNVRELRNVLERAVLLSRDERIGPGDLRFAFARPAEPRPSEGAATLKDVERRHIEATLRAAGGNIEQTARTLGISKSSLYERLKRFGIEPFES
jgi:DNA-binding NtrC family response regulator